MPLTFPSHAAAILPFCRPGSRLPPTALVIGTCAPDLAYLFDIRTNFHVWPGALFPCLPIAFAFFLGFEALLLPTLSRFTRLAATRGLPTTPSGWMYAVLALIIGAVTHIVWDGFTHARFPANLFYPPAVAHSLQLLSSGVGIVLVVRALVRRVPLLPPVALQPGISGGVLVGVIASTLVGAWLMLAARWGFTASPAPYGAGWHLFWYGARGALLGLCAASVLEILGRKTPRSAMKPAGRGATRPG